MTTTERCPTCGEPINGRPIAGEHDPWDHDPGSIARAYENEADAIREHNRKREREDRRASGWYAEPVPLDAFEQNGNVSLSPLTLHRRRCRYGPEDRHA